MKNYIKYIFSSSAVFAVPFLISAQGLAEGDAEAGQLGSYLESILTFIDEAVIPFILAIGFLIFVWGMFKYFIQGGASDEAKESGKSLILYAIAGYVVILAFWGIVNLISGAIGFEGDTIEAPGANLIGN